MLGLSWPSSAASAASGPELTVAELRVLPLLATHLSQDRRRAVRLASDHHVAGALAALKLGVPSRSKAVAQAPEPGLLEG